MPVDMSSPPPNQAVWDAQTHVCLHCHRLTQLPEGMLSICRNLIPSVQPSSADRLAKELWEMLKQNHWEFSALLFPCLLFLLLKFTTSGSSNRVTVTAHDLLLISLNTACKKTQQLHVFYLKKKPVFKVFYHNQQEHINKNAPQQHAVQTAVPAVPTSGVTPDSSYEW